jgi:hypothetical protein
VLCYIPFRVCTEISEMISKCGSLSVVKQRWSNKHRTKTPFRRSLIASQRNERKLKQLRFVTDVPFAMPTQHRGLCHAAFHCHASYHPCSCIFRICRFSNFRKFGFRPNAEKLRGGWVLNFRSISSSSAEMRAERPSTVGGSNKPSTRDSSLRFFREFIIQTKTINVTGTAENFQTPSLSVFMKKYNDETQFSTALYYHRILPFLENAQVFHYSMNFFPFFV